MTDFSVSVEGHVGLTWPLWKRLVAEVERLGFSGLFRSDHLTLRWIDLDSLELVVSLAYLAEHTEHVHFGSLVAPLSIRDPVLLARQALALDDLSGGRMVLGLGAGWMEREHEMFGYILGDVPRRFARFGEGLDVITHLLHSDAPVSYAGSFFRLKDAVLLPRPHRIGGPPILIGGTGTKRTLPLVARYADIWNAVAVTPAEFKESSSILDALIDKEGRRRHDVRRTVLLYALVWHDLDELERRLSWVRRQIPTFAAMSVDELTESYRQSLNAFSGSPEELVEYVTGFVEAGADEVIFQWFGLDDVDGLTVLAEQVVSPLRSAGRFRLDQGRRSDTLTDTFTQRPPDTR